jgi:hypothetical protein
MCTENLAPTRISSLTIYPVPSHYTHQAIPVYNAIKKRGEIRTGFWWTNIGDGPIPYEKKGQNLIEVCRKDIKP